MRKQHTARIIKTEDGILYGFQQPNHVASFALREDAELTLRFDTTAWTMQ